MIDSTSSFKYKFIIVLIRVLSVKELIIATSNPGKFAEFQTLLAPIHCIAPSHIGIDSVEETGLSFIENAIIKARHACRLTQKPALADDSGIVVAALDGAPGIYSARFAGQNATNEDNIELLLERLSNIPSKDRKAYFYCALALVRYENDPTPIIATGQLNGTINNEPRGEQGFGYDPIMYITKYKRTVAELPAEVKNTISHRAHALKHLRKQLHLAGEL